MFKKIGWVAWWLGIWVVFFAIGTKRLDPDFGWHIQSGAEIWKNKSVHKTDPFSYTMPSYTFVDHEWLTNVGMYLGWKYFGYTFLVGVFATVVWLMLWILTVGKSKFWSVLPILLGLETLMNRAGVRPQAEDWLFLAVIIKWLGNRKGWRKTRWLFPGLMVLWVNLHGGFALGIFFGALMVVLAWWQEKKTDFRDVLVGVAGICATFINPYGPKMWWEVWMQMTDTNLRLAISEWMPFYNNIEFGFWFLAALTGAFVWRYIRQLSWSMVGVALVTFVAGLSSLRHMALFAVAAIPLATDGILKFYEEIREDESKVDKGKLVFGFFGVISAMIVGYSLTSNLGILNQSTSFRYPAEAVTFLKDNPFEGNLFAPYEWGGYLIAYYPEKKVFIDGRMPSWRREKVVSGESKWAFKDYMNILQKGEYEEVFEKHNVRRVVWRNVEKESGEVPKLKFGPLVWNLTNRSETLHLILKEKLESDGWEKIYFDKTTIIFER